MIFFSEKKGKPCKFTNESLKFNCDVKNVVQIAQMKSFPKIDIKVVTQLASLTLTALINNKR